MPQNSTEIDAEALRALYGSSEVARLVLDHFAQRTNSSSKTTVNRLMSKLRSEGHAVERADVRKVLRDLDAIGCGTFVVGRKGHPSRFEWQFSLVDVGKIASGARKGTPQLIGTTQVLEAAGDDELVDHPFRLRHDLEISLSLPMNLTQAEAGRIADFVRALPFA